MAFVNFLIFLACPLYNFYIFIDMIANSNQTINPNFINNIKIRIISPNSPIIIRTMN